MQILILNTTINIKYTVWLSLFCFHDTTYITLPKPYHIGNFYATCVMRTQVHTFIV